MILQDWIGFAGVFLLLIAFVLTLMKKITMESIPYTALNTIGAGLACVASIMIPYWPFVILEAIWTAVSAIAMIRAFQK